MSVQGYVLHHSALKAKKLPQSYGEGRHFADPFGPLVFVVTASEGTNKINELYDTISVAIDGKKATEFGEVSCSDLWIRKLRTVFRKLDIHGNGYITVDDILDIASELMTIFPKMEIYKGEELMKGLVDLWFSYLSIHREEKKRPSAIVHEHVFIDNFKNTVNGAFKENFESVMVKPFFNVADGDNDGMITMLEYRNLMKCWKVPDKESDLLFKMIDGNRKGKITMDEFHCALAEYYFGEETKSKMKLFGPLVSYKRSEDYGNIGCGPYWEGKMRTMFRRLDVTGNGTLTCHDFIQIARGIIQRGHLDKKKADAVMRGMLNIWVKYIAVDGEGHRLTEINEKAFIHNLRDMINGEYRHEIDQFGWTFFKAVETAGNGFINQQEFRNFHEAWRVPREEAEGIFQVIDHDKDGKITSDEYLNAWNDYFLGEDQASPFKSFFGSVKSNH